MDCISNQGVCLNKAEEFISTLKLKVLFDYIQTATIGMYGMRVSFDLKNSAFQSPSSNLAVVVELQLTGVLK